MTSSSSPSLADLLAPLRETAVQTARLVKHLGVRLDALSLDLARDLGEVTRDVQALANLTTDRATTLYRATPRAAKLARIATVMFARQRVLRLAAAARGEDGLSEADHRALAKQACAYAGELRGGIAKLGQLASCRPDLVGPIWAAELRTLQDEVPPVDTAAIRERIAASLGRPLDEVFATFDDTPLAAASLAQVHTATLASPGSAGARSTAERCEGTLDGTRVAVKVQVPGIEDVIAADIAALRTIAAAVGDVPGVDLPVLVDELARALDAELDYVAEAAALVAFASAAPANPQVVLPRPIAQASSARVLTMSMIEGDKLAVALETMPPVERDRLIGVLVDEVAQQILVRGKVHADPHPGNFLVTPEGKLAILDFGCTLELSREERAAYARLVMAIAGANNEAAARELEALGFRADDPHKLVELTSSIVGALKPGALVADLDWSAAFAGQLAAAKQLGGLAIPRSFVLLGRVLATIAGLLAQHKPKLAIHAVIMRHLIAATRP